MHRVVLAFDSFKGSLTATEACEAAADALRAAFGEQIDAIAVPMADGGEGSLELAAKALELQGVPVQRIELPVSDAIGRARPTSYLLVNHADGALEALVEMASAAGLAQLAAEDLSPLTASSFGVGELVLDALGRGANAITVLLGGSATTDGGEGVLRALGARFLDADGSEIEHGGAALAELAELELDGFDARARAASWRFVTDVDAPLTGPSGAAAVYGPQKGASAADVAVLDAALGRLASVAAEALGVEASMIVERQGAGAAGGLAAVLGQLTDAEFIAGGSWFVALTGLDSKLAGAELVITGEGSFDAQSMRGKVVSAVLAAASSHGVCTAVIAGSVGMDSPPGIPAFSLSRGPASLRQLQRDAQPLLRRATVAVVGAVIRGLAVTSSAT